MPPAGLDNLRAEVSALNPVRQMGRVDAASGSTASISGLSGRGRIGDLVELVPTGHPRIGGEIVAMAGDRLTVLAEGRTEGLAIGDPAVLLGDNRISPDDTWIGRVIDPFGRPLDDRPLMRGSVPRPLVCAPPPPVERRLMGARLETGLAAFNTLLPIVRGQRVGLFAGSGVGKSTLLAMLAQEVAADIVVIGLIGERGREVREFVEQVLGPEGMRRSVVVAATSDRSPLQRRRCGWAAMAVAEHFRDRGRHVLLLVDSVTRFAEAHREVALAAGEAASYRGFPPSAAHIVPALCERAGPGAGGTGDITAVFSVLVAGSDMEEPVADLMRGVLDGHVVLDREIAERGRFPAIDVLRSVSRALPAAATEDENETIALARRLMAAYSRAELMVQAGLYVPGSDPETDAAISVWPALDGFMARRAPEGIAGSFADLRMCLAAQPGKTV